MAVQQEGSHQDILAAQDKPRRSSRRRAAYILSEEDEFLLQQLPTQYAEILRQDGTMEDIARRLQVPMGTVKSRTHRARAALDVLRAQSRQNTPQ